jgi:hypothetical protein
LLDGEVAGFGALEDPIDNRRRCEHLPTGC